LCVRGGEVDVAWRAEQSHGRKLCRALDLGFERRQLERRGAGGREQALGRRTRVGSGEADERDAERSRLVAQGFPHRLRCPGQCCETRVGRERADGEARRSRIRGTRARELVAVFRRAREQCRELFAVRQARERAAAARRRDDDEMI
jgi:hypothetical protein